jgi:hypothetical protein
LSAAIAAAILNASMKRPLKITGGGGISPGSGKCRKYGPIPLSLISPLTGNLDGSCGASVTQAS